MTISNSMISNIDCASFIRKMFYKGQELKKKHGEENVFDFSIGNPIIEPPAEFKERLISLIKSPEKGMHRYMNNAGYPGTRKKIADHLSVQEGIEFSPENIVMSCGAGGGLNVIFKTILNPDDEVIIIAPYFVEYFFYIANHGGKVVIADANEDFSLNIANIEKKITNRTKAILINTPNNPTGKVYSEEDIKNLCRMLTKKQAESGSPLYLINDEPYRKVIYEGIRIPKYFPYYNNLFSVTSHSKDLGIPGQRIGYIYFHPAIDDPKMAEGLSIATRILGFVNAPAIFQKAVEEMQSVSVDIKGYQYKRDLICDSLKEFGYEIEKPEGTFYVFPKAPIKDDVLFTNKLQEKLVLVVPGSGFGWKGYFRIAFCTDDLTIQRSLQAFKEVLQIL